MNPADCLLRTSLTVSHPVDPKDRKDCLMRIPGYVTAINCGGRIVKKMQRDTELLKALGVVNKPL